MEVLTDSPLAKAIQCEESSFTGSTHGLFCKNLESLPLIHAVSLKNVNTWFHVSQLQDKALI